MKVVIPCHIARQRHPVAFLKVLTMLRASRSKEREATPESLTWAYDCARHVDGPPPRSMKARVEWFLSRVHFALSASKGRWVGAANIPNTTVPPEIRAVYMNKPEPPPPKQPVQHVRVGVAAILRQNGQILMGKRKGSHGAGTWSFPGGHLEWGEKPTEAAAREVQEETGLVIPASRFTPMTFTNDIFEVEGKHYITLYVQTVWYGDEPRVMEPHKCSEWRWVTTPPKPLFLPIKNLLKTTLLSSP